MAQERKGPEGVSSHDRQQTVDALCEAFARDEVGVEEFERRVEIAHRAASGDELRALLTDLPSAQAPLPVPASPSSPSTGRRAPAPATRRQSAPYQGDVRPWSFSVGIMGGMNRQGAWVPAERNVAIGVMGGCVLDFREAAMPPGITEVHTIAIWGGVEILVPPWLRVETSGVGIMGGFDHRNDAPVPDDPNAPVLRVSGIALMGGVEVKMRLPGETAKDARRRIADEKKARRLLRKARDQEYGDDD